MRVRVCAAIIRDDSILMVKHQEAGRVYWTLPGGGVEPGETPEAAVVREVWEETGLTGSMVRFLWEETIDDGTKQCLCFLVEAATEHEAQLGFDPEQIELPAEERMLQDVEWHSLRSMKDDCQVAQVLRCLNQS